MGNEITIQAAQEKVDNWIKTVGVKYFSELTNLGILMEEVGELSRIMVRKFGDQSFKNKEEEALLADEMADVLFVLICLANQTGIDLATALEKNIQKKSLRDASRHQNNEKLHR
jgi:NTP pyrophosphatase (non-canonical NTP hydrolase)